MFICAAPSATAYRLAVLQSSRADVVPPQIPSPTFPMALRILPQGASKTPYSQGPIYFAAEYEDERGKVKEIQRSDHARETCIVARIIGETGEIHRKRASERQPCDDREDHPRPHVRKPDPAGRQKNVRRKQCGHR